MRYIFLSIVCLTCWTCQAKAAIVTEYTNKAAWQAAVGSYSTIDFTGFAHGTTLNTQYAESHGVTFIGTNNIVHTSSFLNDGEGVRGQPESRFVFSTPRHSVAVDFPGQAIYKLYYSGVLVYTSNPHWAPVGGGGFYGLVSDTLFDEVVVYRNTGNPAFYDDLHFGPPIPAPGALGVFALAAFGCRRRRRS
ncbi:MAG TPA: hypothetical protein PK400_08200 [Phycisphaerales bacterium]|nr:hypothetical protein [Phycisphaerales bacterium]HRQ75395.1 hypothetical protein [Phycisphaerales bacterium]